MGYKGPQWAASGPRGITAPEPYTEQPPPPQRQYPVHLYPGDSEFGFGPGLVPPCYNGRPPSQGGIYMPKCPPVDESGRQKPHKPGETRGYPGDPVAP